MVDRAGERAENAFLPAAGLHTLPRATLLTQPVTTCVRPFVSYAGCVEQVTWLMRKSHRSSAPPNEQGRNGARPHHSPGAVVPQAGPEVVGSPAPTPDESAGAVPPAQAVDATGRAEPGTGSTEPGTGSTADSEHGTHDEHGPASQDPAQNQDPARSQDPAQSEQGPASGYGPEGGHAPVSQHGPAGGRTPEGEPTPAAEHGPAGEPRPAGEPERESALRAAAANSAFRAATQLVWPGTEDRLAEPARPAEPAPDPAASSWNPSGTTASDCDASGTAAPAQPAPDQPAPDQPAGGRHTADLPAAAAAGPPGRSCPGYPVLGIRALPTRPGPTSGSRAGCTRSRCCAPGGGPARHRPVSRASARDGPPRRRVRAPARPVQDNRPVQDKLRHPASHGRISRAPAGRRRASPRQASRDQKRTRASAGRGPTTRRCRRPRDRGPRPLPRCGGSRSRRARIRPTPAGP